MVSQGATAQSLEASVIAGFNAKLAQRAQWLQGNNTGVRSVCSFAAASAYPSLTGQDVALGLVLRVHDGAERPDGVRLRRQHVVWPDGRLLGQRLPPVECVHVSSFASAGFRVS